MTNQGRGYILANRYRIERRLGAGSSATVFEATDANTGQRVAVKVVHHLFRKDRTIRKRFLREAGAARALSTPHAVKVLDVGQLSQGIPYLVMELLDGSTLERVIRRERGMSIERALFLTDQIAAGLQDAHGMDVVHRDLKPENIFLVEVGGDAFVKIVDFGISKLIGDQEVSQLTGTGVMVGTPVYMAPEQIEGWKDIDGRVDVYSLGVVMFEMLAGASPFAAATDFTSLLRMLMGAPPTIRQHRPDVPQGLASLIASAMTPDRAQRLPNMESLRLGIAPYWSGRRPCFPSYGTIALLDEAHRDPSDTELFEPDESVSSTRTKRVEVVRSPMSGAPQTRRDVVKPPLPPLARRGPVPRPSRPPPPPPPRKPAASGPHFVRPPFRSSIEPSSRLSDDPPRRDETDIVWPPRRDPDSNGS
jgi:serine/threonine-protein kinase